MASNSFAADKVKGRILSIGIGGLMGNIDPPAPGGRPALVGRVGTYRAGTWVPVLVELKNVSGEPRKVQLSVSGDDLDNDSLSSYSASYTLPDSEPHNVWIYYWPSPSDTGTGISSVAIHGDDDATRGEIVGTATIPYFNTKWQLTNSEITALFPAEGRFYHPNKVPSAWRNVVVLGKGNQGWNYFAAAKGQNAAVFPVLVSDPLNLPSNAMGLDGVDIIVWNTNEVRVSAVAEGYQRKAIIDWVRAGGHLILIAPSAFGELEALEGKNKEIDLLPATPEAYRAFTDEKASLKAYFTQFDFPGLMFVRDANGDNKNPYYSQLTLPQGDIFNVFSKPKTESGAHAIMAIGAQTPIAYVRPYGSGFVTMLTVNVSDPAFQRDQVAIGPSHWVAFWSRIAGFVGTATSIHEENNKTNVGNYAITEAGLASSGTDVPSLLDVTSLTQSRLLFAVLFLLAYWVIAGPGGHAVLKAYKKVYWSWWTFGFVVIIATVIATGAAYFLRITYETIRHQTFIVGTANSGEVTIKGYYGVLTPSSGNVKLELPSTPGLSYIAPLYPFSRESSGFSPRQYVTQNDLNGQSKIGPDGKPLPASIEVPFRRTLKRVEARWNGSLDQPLITGSLQRIAYTDDRPQRVGPGGTNIYDGISKFRGVLRNDSGYTLKNVSIVYGAQKKPPERFDDSETQILDNAQIAYFHSDWKSGESLDFNNKMAPTYSKFLAQTKLGVVLYNMARTTKVDGSNLSVLENEDGEKVYDFFISKYRTELLNFFADATYAGSPWQRTGAMERNVHINRPYTRTLDRTNVLRTLGAVLIAEISDEKEENAPPSFLPIKVDGQKVPTHGKTMIAIGIKLDPYVPPPPPPPTRPATTTATKPASTPATPK